MYHARQAGDARAIRALVPAAAAHGSSLGAHREAAAHYALALAHSEEAEPADRLPLLLGRSSFCYLAGPLDDAVATRPAAMEARWRLGDAADEAEDLGALSHMVWLLGRTTAALRMAEHARDLLEPAGPSLQLARAYVQLAELHAYGRHPARAAGFAEKASALADRFDEPLVGFEAKSHAAGACLLLGDGGWDDLEAARIFAI